MLKNSVAIVDLFDSLRLVKMKLVSDGKQIPAFFELSVAEILALCLNVLAPDWWTLILQIRYVDPSPIVLLNIGLEVFSLKK